MHNLAESRSIVLKLADKESSVLVGNQRDLLAGGCKQLSNRKTCIDFNTFTEKELSDLLEKSNKIFRNLCNKRLIIE